MKVRFTRSAEIDLLAISDWISSDNPVRATSFLRGLEVKCRSLANRPKRFPVVAEIGGRHLRKVSYHNYVILYLADKGSVEILRIVHGSRDWYGWIEDLK